MRNERLGVDKDYGLFYVFDYRHAKCVVRLLCNNSYVRFGDTYFKQTKGIPMGINPAVFMANYYLFFYEFTFVKQLVDIIDTCPPPATQLEPVHMLMTCSIAQLHPATLTRLWLSFMEMLLYICYLASGLQFVI
jgi:hypothetical protein